MNRLLSLAAFGVCLAAARPAHAQDYAQYQQQASRCASEQQEMTGKINALRDEQETALRELQQGFFCSKCKNSKTTIEKGGESFEGHLGRVKGERVAATPAEIDANQRKFMDQIHSLRVQKDSKEKECERLSSSYANAKRAADSRAEQDALRQVQQEADQRKQQEANDKADELAAQKEKEERLAQEQAAERARMVAEIEQRQARERQRQAQFAANTQRYADQLNGNTAATQAELEDHRRNSGLNGVPAYNGGNARNTVATTNNRDLTKEAFGGRQFLGGGTLYNNTKELTQTVMRDKLTSMADNAKNYLKEQVNNFAFGEDPNPQKDDDNGGTAWTEFKSRVKTASIHQVGNRLLEADSKSSGVLNKLYAPFQRAQQELSLYESRTLKQFNRENTEFISKAYDAVTSTEDSGNFQKVSDEFFQNTPKRFIGVMNNWFGKGKRVYIDELTD